MTSKRERRVAVAGSDLDLLVTFDPEASLFAQVNMRSDIEALLGVRVDLVSERALDDRHADIRNQARDL